MGDEQKGCRRGYRGAKDHLMLDKVIMRDCKQTGLAIGWIDYQKAYDVVPHSWISETPEMVGMAEGVSKFLCRSMKEWTTNLAKVDIKEECFKRAHCHHCSSSFASFN